MFLLRTIQLLIGTSLSGAWILKYEIQIYHVDQSFSYDTVAYGHGELVYLKHKFKYNYIIWTNVFALCTVAVVRKQKIIAIAFPEAMLYLLVVLD